ncbi:hypothetical protein BurJ1DRAFT_0981 [Burkholderiales bacterium JOSHI_001]|nr:hypothetical protein BurJ1DRAFT_0981 [Burkholderiales bacterium JOSHI_001]
MPEDSKVFVPPPEAWGLVLQIREARAARLEGLQAIVDGAVLAVEQVQDKRIEVLEKGPEVQVQDVVFDLLIGLALGQVGTLLKACTAPIAGDLGRAAGRYAKLSRKKQILKSLGKDTLPRDAAKFEALFGSATPDRRVTAAQVNDYAKAVRSFVATKVGAAIDSAGEASLGIVKSGLPKTGGKQVDLEETDSPSVAMLGAAQSFMSAQRYAQALFHDALEIVVLTTPCDQTELDEIAQAMVPTRLDAGLAQVRDRHKMLFEAVLWWRLFNLSKGSTLRSHWFLSGRSKLLDLGGAPEPLLRYWLHRFGRTIQQTLQSDHRLLQGSDSEKQRRFETPFQDLDLLNRQSLLKQFFDMVGNDFDSALRETGKGPQACGFVTTLAPIPKTS